MNIQWYPGHMTKARRMMQENIKLVDIVIELVDARVPSASRNPDIIKLANNKPIIVVLNKIDLADDKETQKWMEYFKEECAGAVAVNSNNGRGINTILTTAKEVCKEKIERDKKRGLINRPIRAMVVGIPNVGKSTFINKLVGKASAKTGNKPGITKGKQWIKLKRDIELLDTPGILWPKFEDQQVGINLALIGSIKTELLDSRELTFHMIEFMMRKYKSMFLRNYEIEEIESKTTMEILEEMTISRNMKKTGNLPDIDRMSVMLLDEFKNAKYGRVTIEQIEDYVKEVK